MYIMRVRHTYAQMKGLTICRTVDLGLDMGTIYIYITRSRSRCVYLLLYYMVYVVLRVRV